MRKPIALIIGAAAAAAAFWAYGTQRRHPAPVPIVDGKTIDFSTGRPVVREDPADKAAVDAAVRDIDQAVKGVTFTPQPAPK
ncbi:MAG TPA: hypothetical protein VGG34_14380 [Opitutaceae bacterium]|jgi:hypothetical protein